MKHRQGILGLLAFAVLAVAPGARAALREMNTDRPDATESPFTVDAGHWQVEMDFANYSRDRQDGVTTTERGVAPVNLRRGVTTDFELGIFLEPYRRVTVRPGAGPSVSGSGSGDVTLRAKVNFRGNDGGASAFGLIADLKLPAASGALGNGKLEGALTLPVAFSLPQGWELGAMTQLGAAYGDAGRYRAVWNNTITLGHDLTASAGGYVEFVSETGDGAHVATLNVGVTWKLDANTQLDCGGNFGLSRSAPDRQFFAGLSVRF